MKPPCFAIVYQSGIANVFRYYPNNPGGKTRGARHFQGAFRDAEQFMRGARAAGADVRIFHCDKAGDVSHWEWEPGTGSLFADGKSII